MMRRQVGRGRGLWRAPRSVRQVAAHSGLPARAQPGTKAYALLRLPAWLGLEGTSRYEPTSTSRASVMSARCSLVYPAPARGVWGAADYLDNLCEHANR